jgi:hypothetical protein
MFVYYPIEPYTDIVIISGQRMAQTRRMGKRNQWADRPKAPRFSPNYVPFLAGLAFLLFKLMRMSSRLAAAGRSREPIPIGLCGG